MCKFRAGYDAAQRGRASGHVVPCRATVLHEGLVTVNAMHRTVAYFQNMGLKAMERAETA